MKKKSSVIITIVIILLFAFGLSCMVVTGEDEYKLIRQFGKVDKIPFIQSVDTLPKEIQIYDLAPSDVITQDKKAMITNSYVLWRITEPLKFAQTLNSSIGSAESRINTVIYNSVKNVISSMPQEAIISGRNGELTKAITNNVGKSFGQYGIELVTIEVKQLDLPSDNKDAVYERMISERGNIAATYTAEGASEAQKIKNTTDKEVSIMISEAEKQAEILKAEGEAEYMKILSEAYEDESKTDFYSFVRSLDALKSSVKGENKTVILSEDSPIAQIFNGN